jgi:hypothetical protein
MIRKRRRGNPEARGALVEDPLPDRVTEERIARNDALFRDANERIGAFAAEHELREHAVPFICECADMSCHEIVTLPLDEYERVRSNPRRFVNAPGHHVAAQGAATVVERHSGYAVVEKQGHAGEVAEELASREGQAVDG